MSETPVTALDRASDDALRFERACEWFIELRERLNSPDAVASWLEWCSADPRNREAFEQARRVWAVTETADESNLGLGIPAADSTANATAAIAGHSTPGTLPNVRRRPGRWTRPLVLGTALAATVATVTVITRVLWTVPAPQSSSLLSTPVGVNRVVTLSDGSTVTLGGGSRVATTLDSKVRRLTLESGEAYFKVARDRQRPFIVDAGPVRVTALGTEFNVRTGEDRIVVAIAQGLVEIDSSARTAGSTSTREPLRAGAGETFSLDTADASMQLAHADPVNMASWQQGRLEFTREPLSAVIDSVNRYSGRHIALSDAALGELRFTGTVFTDRVDDWIRGLPQIFPVAVREDAREVAIVVGLH